MQLPLLVVITNLQDSVLGETKVLLDGSEASFSQVRMVEVGCNGFEDTDDLTYGSLAVECCDDNKVKRVLSS